KLNLARSCVHSWAERTPDASAAVFLGEDGERRELTWAEMSRDVTRLAEALVGLGIEAGDRVAFYMPMCPEVAIASHACAHVGAVQVPVFSGFAAPAVAQRLVDSGAKVAITAETSSRRGKTVPMLAIVEEARRDAPALEHVLVAPWDEEVAAVRSARRSASPRVGRTGRPTGSGASSRRNASRSSAARRRSCAP